MSGPKGGSYQVETAAQLEARMLRDAKADYARAQSAWDSSNALLSAVATVSGESLTTARPTVPAADADSAAYARAAAELLEAADGVAAMAAAARERVAARRHMVSIARIVDSLAASSQTEAPKRPTVQRRTGAATPSASATSAIDRVGTEQRVRRRLDALAGFDHNTAQVEALVSDIAAARSQSRIDLLVRELDLVIDDARAALARVEKIRAVRAELSALEARAAALSGPVATGLRERIARLLTEEVISMPPDLPALVEEAIRHADAEADWLHVVRVMNAALKSLGYRVGPDFSTELAGERATAYARSGSSRYGIKVRLEPGSARFTAQAVKSDAALTSPQEDAAAERDFCAALDSLVAVAARDGVSLDVDIRVKPGAYEVQQVSDAQLGSASRASEDAAAHEDRVSEMMNRR